MKAMQVDLDVLTSIDVSSEPIHYLVDAIKLDYDLASKQISNKNLPVENEHLIKSLVENCVISNIKDPKEV
ncbi:hypothetical protein [Candidatus Mycoplasma haematohominis]|uniref:hypothetical protein n=1 Tax=Candidatus Mycoplasma haematohominis TaxID=1494318 RepID=UPI001C0A6D86|nr:hypothetical protein [Candidatus Mycoplasma haemohominis]